MIKLKIKIQEKPDGLEVSMNSPPGLDTTFKEQAFYGAVKAAVRVILERGAQQAGAGFRLIESGAERN